MRFFVFLILVLICPLSLAEEALFVPSFETGRVVRAHQFQIFRGKESDTWDRFDQVRLGSQWQPPKADTVNLIGQKVVWVKIPIAANQSTKSDWRLEIQWPSTALIEMAVWNEHNGLTEVQRSGRILKSPGMNLQKNNLFEFSLPQGQAATIYLRVVDPYLVYLPMMIFSADAFAKYNLIRTVLFSMAFGIMAVMIMYNLFLYIAVYDKMYLFYSNTVFSSLLYILAVSGYGEMFFWHNNRWLVDHASSIFAAYCFFSVTYFFRVFLELSRYRGWMLWSNNILLVSYGAVILMTLSKYLPYGILLLGVLSPLIGVILMTTAIVLWRRGNHSAIYFIVAWCGVGVSTTFLVSSLRGKISYFPAIEYSQASGFVIEIVLLSVALADRIRRQRMAKEQAQSSLLRLREQANKELEGQVRLRTQELESAMIDLKSANRELAKLTKLDPLTNVNNRRQFDCVAEVEIEKAKELGRPLAVIMVDIDHFKAINDNYGHVLGDKCLIQIANCIAQNVRGEEDFVARYGGEEFAVILPNTEEADAYKLAERIRGAIEKTTLIYDGKSIHMTASFGVCSHQPSSEDAITTFVKAADSALYQAKEEGRNRVVADSILNTNSI